MGGGTCGSLEKKVKHQQILNRVNIILFSSRARPSEVSLGRSLPQRTEFDM
jgi:hypothetical protein